MKISKGQISKYYFIIFFLFINLMACSGGDGSAPQLNSDGFLQGNDSEAALLKIIAYDDSSGVDDNDVIILPDPDGRHVALTQLEIWLEDDATVGGVNQALQDVNARIIIMIPNVPILLIGIQRSADLSALETISDKLLSYDAIRQVGFVSMSSTASLPSNHGFLDIESLNDIYQLIATKNIAARNAKDALATELSKPPTIIVADYFGGGKPGAAFDAITDISDYNTGAPHEHGYHVLGIITALDGGTSLVTGAYPDTAFVKAVDLRVSSTVALSSSEWENKVLLIMLDSPGNYVVNSSLCIECGDPAGPCSEDILRDDAYKFMTKVRNAGLEDSYLHVNAAGNRAGGYTYAYQSSDINYAALRSDIVDSTGSAVTPLSNVMAVENVVISLNSIDAPSEPWCLSSGSVSGGHISAPGHYITSFVDANGTEGEMRGTSMAAPAVTAAAAYFWALNPDLSPQDVKQQLLNTASPVSVRDWEGCAEVEPQPFLDVYRAILSSDDPVSLESFNPEAGRIRGTILDVADGSGFEGSNGLFDNYDIDYFLLFYGDSAIAGQLDYSRYDLNGDGYTGGSNTTVFDLDMDQMIEEHVAQTIGDIEIIYDENAMNDKEILCYYAHSSLYSGDTEARDYLIGGDCGILLTPFRAELPCTGPAFDDEIDCSTVSNDYEYMYLEGEEGKSYDVTIRVRGVVEQKTYYGSTDVDGMWASGGIMGDEPFNSYTLEISSPPQTYYLNYGESYIGRCFVMDIEKTVVIDNGAEVRVSAYSHDNYQILNQDSTGGTPLVIPDIPPAPSAFNGQFIQLDVLSIEKR